MPSSVFDPPGMQWRCKRRRSEKLTRYVAINPLLGIDTKSLNVKRQDPEVAKWVEVLKEKYAGLKLIVARDKLDYIKGVRQKMLAFERFLNMYPEYQGKVIVRPLLSLDRGLHLIILRSG